MEERKLTLNLGYNSNRTRTDKSVVMVEVQVTAQEDNPITVEDFTHGVEALIRESMELTTDNHSKAHLMRKHLFVTCMTVLKLMGDGNEPPKEILPELFTFMLANMGIISLGGDSDE